MRIFCITLTRLHNYRSSVFGFTVFDVTIFLSPAFSKKCEGTLYLAFCDSALRPSGCMVVNPITVYSLGFNFNFMTVGQASDSMTALT